MFDSTSRYFTIASTKISVPDPEDGTREISYVKRRMIPFGEGMATLVEHTVAQGERLDLITARYLGEPTQFWRVCDANNVIEPEELEETERIIKITLPNL